MTQHGIEPRQQSPDRRVAMLCYTSRPIPGLEPSRLRALLHRSRIRNRAEEITGCLIFDRERIVQILEGEAGAVRDLFARIARDPRHECVRLLFDGQAHRREFPATPMACYNLAWRHVRDAESASRAVSGLLGAGRVDLTDIVAMARLFHFLDLPQWAGHARAATTGFAHVAMPE